MMSVRFLNKTYKILLILAVILISFGIGVKYGIGRTAVIIIMFIFLQKFSLYFLIALPIIYRRMDDYMGAYLSCIVLALICLGLLYLVGESVSRKKIRDSGYNPDAVNTFLKMMENNNAFGDNDNSDQEQFNRGTKTGYTTKKRVREYDITINSDSFGSTIEISGDEIELDKNVHVGDQFEVEDEDEKRIYTIKKILEPEVKIQKTKSSKKPIKKEKSTGLKGKNKIIEVEIGEEDLGKTIKYQGNKIGIPVNVEIGDQWIIKGKGYESDSGGKNGDLIYVVKSIG